MKKIMFFLVFFTISNQYAMYDIFPSEKKPDSIYTKAIEEFLFLVPVPGNSTVTNPWIAHWPHEKWYVVVKRSCNQSYEKSRILLSLLQNKKAQEEKLISIK